MRNVLAIAGRESRAYFVSPLAYVIIGFFLLVTGFFFDLFVRSYAMATLQAGTNPLIAQQLNVHDALIRPLYQNLHVILLFVVPLLSMRAPCGMMPVSMRSTSIIVPVSTTEMLPGSMSP